MNPRYLGVNPYDLCLAPPKSFPPLLGVSKSFPERLVLELQLFGWFRRSRLVSYDFNVQTIWKNISGPKTCSERFITCFISIKISHVYHIFSLLWLPKLHTLTPRLSHTFVCSRTASTTSANAVQTFVPSGRRHCFSFEKMYKQPDYKN